VTAEVQARVTARALVTIFLLARSYDSIGKSSTPDLKINHPLIPGGAKCAEISRIRVAFFDSPVPIGRRKQSDPGCVASIAFWNERDTIALSGEEMATNFTQAQ
jgi:hypothetical protein